jgi:phosphatidylserine decarboxylase
MTLALVLAGGFFALFAAWRFLFFFRNPDRKVKTDDRLILSPADGFVMYVRRVLPGEPVISIKEGHPILLDDLMTLDDPCLPRQGWLVGIYMSPLDVHYNRAPIRGFVRKISHGFPARSGGVNRNMFHGQSNLFFNIHPFWRDCDYLVQNERASFVFSNEALSVYVTQIADRWVRKIVTFRDRVTVAQGEVFGLIRMGSQVDLFVPDTDGGFEALITERVHVRAGIDALFRRPPSGPDAGSTIIVA